MRFFERFNLNGMVLSTVAGRSAGGRGREYGTSGRAGIAAGAGGGALTAGETRGDTEFVGFLSCGAGDIPGDSGLGAKMGVVGNARRLSPCLSGEKSLCFFFFGPDSKSSSTGSRCGVFSIASISAPSISSRSLDLGVWSLRLRVGSARGVVGPAPDGLREGTGGGAIGGTHWGVVSIDTDLPLSGLILSLTGPGAVGVVAGAGLGTDRGSGGLGAGTGLGFDVLSRLASLRAHTDRQRGGQRF